MSKRTERQAFLEKYNINNGDFLKTALDFDDLLLVKEDYETKFQMYDDAGANLVRILLRLGSVHSVKYRVKDGEHLIEKIIRKTISEPEIGINIDNYHEKIQDLIGIRILHLFKSDWITIHNKLIDNFKMVQDPEANVRKGDAEKDYKDAGCQVKIHKAGYRSVHYIIKTEPTIKTLLAEIQVRTILEEAWSEIDHKIRYPYFLDNEIINQYLQIFNRLAGGADEMGDYVQMLKNEVVSKETKITELQGRINKLEDKLKSSSLKGIEKEELETDIDSLKSLGTEIFHQTYKPWTSVSKRRYISLSDFLSLDDDIGSGPAA